MTKMDATTIKVHDATKNQLNQFREYQNESYDELIQKLVFIAKKCRTEPKLSKETIEAIEKARSRIKKGMYLSEPEARKRLGI